MAGAEESFARDLSLAWAAEVEVDFAGDLVTTVLVWKPVPLGFLMCLVNSSCACWAPVMTLEGVGAAGVFKVGSAPVGLPVPGAAGVEELGAVEGAPARSCEGRPKFTIGGFSGATLLFSRS